MIEGMSEANAFSHRQWVMMQEKNDKMHQDLYDGSDGLQRTAQRVIKYGYPFERLNLECSDGQYICMHRISGGKNVRPEDIYKNPKPVVVLMHGFCGSSSDFLINKEKSLAFLLADAGFDVWMPNWRGNTWSKMHRFLDEHDKEFWDFSIEQWAEIDCHETIEFILKETK